LDLAIEGMRRLDPHDAFDDNESCNTCGSGPEYRAAERMRDMCIRHTKACKITAEPAVVAKEANESHLDAIDAIMSAVADCSEDFTVSICYDSMAAQWYVTVAEHDGIEAKTKNLRKLTVPGEDLEDVSASFVKALHALNPPRKTCE